jgi:hypothetical protein
MTAKRHRKHTAMVELWASCNADDERQMAVADMRSSRVHRPLAAWLNAELVRTQNASSRAGLSTRMFLPSSHSASGKRPPGSVK